MDWHWNWDIGMKVMNRRAFSSALHCRLKFTSTVVARLRIRSALSSIARLRTRSALSSVTKNIIRIDRLRLWTTNFFYTSRQNFFELQLFQPHSLMFISKVVASLLAIFALFSALRCRLQFASVAVACLHTSFILNTSGCYNGHKILRVHRL